MTIDVKTFDHAEVQLEAPDGSLTTETVPASVSAIKDLIGRRKAKGLTVKLIMFSVRIFIEEFGQDPILPNNDFGIIEFNEDDLETMTDASFAEARTNATPEIDLYMRSRFKVTD